MLAIIDDEPDIVSLFKDCLEPLGLPTFIFTDPLIALQHFEVNKENYQIIITDLRMPDIDGIELLKRVKEKNPSVRRILMTAFKIDDKIFQEYLKENLINGFIEKPVALSHLLEEVKRQIHTLSETK